LSKQSPAFSSITLHDRQRDYKLCVAHPHEKTAPTAASRFETESNFVGTTESRIAIYANRRDQPMAHEAATWRNPRQSVARAQSIERRMGINSIMPNRFSG
jgi:hypothetical protein